MLGGGGKDTGGLDEELDAAVQEQVPVERVLVVRDRGDEGDDEFAVAPDLGGALAEVEVLPQDAVVFFVHADRVLDRHRVAVAIGGDPIEVLDLAQAVTAELEGVGHVADVVLTGIKGVLLRLHRGRVTIRDHHLRRARPG